MAIKALNPFAPYWYTPREEEGAQNPTRFKLQGLNGEQMGYISPEFILDPQTKSITALSGKGIDIALTYGLVDWENFQNDAGAVPFVRANFALIPHRLRGELAFQIVIASHVPADAKKT